MSSTSIAPLAAGSRLLAEFRAGKMILEGKMLKADARKGLVRVIRTEDGLVHLEWFERKGHDVDAGPENDVVIFPEEARFEKAPRTAQRVYHLSFTAEPDRNLIFWMQEPSADRDAENCNAVDKAINTPMGMDLDELTAEPEVPSDLGNPILPSDALERGHTSGAPGAGLEAMSAGETVGILPQAPGQEPPDSSQVNTSAAHQLAQMLSGMAQDSAGTTPATRSVHQDPGASLAAALVAALARQARGGGGSGGQRAAGPSLAEVLRPEALAPLLRSQDVLARLAEFLPEQHRSAEAVLALVHSAQFQQQLAAFSAALQTGQLDLSQFGLDARGFSVYDFLSAIQELVDRELQQQQGK